MPSAAALRGGLFLALCILTCVSAQTTAAYMVNANLEATTPASGGCEPDCSSGAELVADPLDCRKFYVCSEGNALGPLECDEGEIFDVTACVPGEECDPTCGGTEASCTYTCSGAQTPVYIVDHYDCSSYYQCDNGELLTCHKYAPFFDGNKCQTDETKCCSCKPYCETGDAGSLIIDPVDCTRYYLCTEDNSVAEYSGHCSEGNFDPFLEECSTTVPCITLCTNVVNNKGCIDVFTCEETGYFPACPRRCGHDYYYCKAVDIGSTVAPVSCPNGDVYNPDNSQCVVLSACPYPEPGL